MKSRHHDLVVLVARVTNGLVTSIGGNEKDGVRPVTRMAGDRRSVTVPSPGLPTAEPTANLVR